MEKLYESIFDDEEEIIAQGKAELIDNQTYDFMWRFVLSGGMGRCDIMRYMVNHQRGEIASDGKKKFEDLLTEYSGIKDGKLFLRLRATSMDNPCIFNEVSLGTFNKFWDGLYQFKEVHSSHFIFDDLPEISPATVPVTKFVAGSAWIKNASNIHNIEFDLRNCQYDGSTWDMDRRAVGTKLYRTYAEYAHDDYGAKGLSHGGLLISSYKPRLNISNVRVNFTPEPSKDNGQMVMFYCPVIPDLSSFWSNCGSIFIYADDLFDYASNSKKACKLLGVNALQPFYKYIHDYLKASEYDRPAPGPAAPVLDVSKSNLSDFINLSGCPKCEAVCVADDRLGILAVKGDGLWKNPFTSELAGTSSFFKRMRSHAYPRKFDGVDFKTNDGWCIYIISTSGTTS